MESNGCLNTMESTWKSTERKADKDPATQERPWRAGPCQPFLWSCTGDFLRRSQSPIPDGQIRNRTASNLVPAAATRAAAAAATAALAGLVAVPAKDRAIATRLKRHCCRLTATRTNHRCSLCRSRTVAGASLIVLLCLTAILATLRGRITTFLKERLISSGEGKILPAIAARK